MCYIEFSEWMKMSEIRLLIDAIADVQLTIHRPFVMKKEKKKPNNEDTK